MRINLFFFEIVTVYTVEIYLRGGQTITKEFIKFELVKDGNRLKSIVYEGKSSTLPLFMNLSSVDAIFQKGSKIRVFKK